MRIRTDVQKYIGGTNPEDFNDLQMALVQIAFIGHEFSVFDDVRLMTASRTSHPRREPMMGFSKRTEHFSLHSTVLATDVAPGTVLVDWLNVEVSQFNALGQLEFMTDIACILVDDDNTYQTTNSRTLPFNPIQDHIHKIELTVPNYDQVSAEFAMEYSRLLKKLHDWYFYVYCHKTIADDVCNFIMDRLPSIYRDKLVVDLGDEVPFEQEPEIWRRIHHEYLDKL